MNNNVKMLLNKAELWYVATLGEEANVVPVGFKAVTDDGHLIIGDMLMETTIRNIQTNSQIAIAATDTQTSEGYQVKGTAEYLTEGDIFEMYSMVADEIFKGAASLKGIVYVTPKKVIVTTASADNKKEL